MIDKAIDLQFTEKEARQYLENWLRAHSIIVFEDIEVVRWDYAGRPFWSAVVKGMKRGIAGDFGFHIHEDGKVTFIGRMDYGE